MPDAPRTTPVPPPLVGAGHEVVASTVLAQLLTNGWLAGHGTTQQLESFLAAMQAVGSAGDAAPADEAPGGAWGRPPARPGGSAGDPGDSSTRGS